MIANAPLVSVICLCYNHERFVQEALASVFNQTYASLEMIIVDDASTDSSVDKIKAFLEKFNTAAKNVQTIFLPANVGNCKAFNTGLSYATGKYIIDFATDDVMLPKRLAQQVACFEQLPAQYGVLFTEAAYIDEQGHFLQYHYQDKLKHLQSHVPIGDVYQHILHKYFICGPTMLVKKTVFDKLEGYDENLAYEDFDFWVRSSRYFHYAYLNKCTTRVRKSVGSLSTKAGKPGDRQLYATYLVCRKAFALNHNEQENQALAQRVRYELRQCLITKNSREALLFLRLLRQLQRHANFYTLLYRLTKYQFHALSLDAFADLLYKLRSIWK